VALGVVGVGEGAVGEHLVVRPGNVPGVGAVAVGVVAVVLVGLPGVGDPGQLPQTVVLVGVGLAVVRLLRELAGGVVGVVVVHERVAAAVRVRQLGHLTHGVVDERGLADQLRARRIVVALQAGQAAAGVVAEAHVDRVHTRAGPGPARHAVVGVVGG